MELKAVGVVDSPYKIKAGSPRQGRQSDEVSKIIIFDKYTEALDGVDRCQYLIVLYWLDRAERDILKATTPGKKKERGVFSIRAPVRPNPIGLCLVKLIQKEGNVLTVKWLDALDQSPVLDIKPFWSDIDCP
jgi:tRNA-Thr(GGU) m(6)t(6)A37 methyltransferase TsaA